MAYEQKDGDKPAKGDEKILTDARDYLKECIEEESVERQNMQDDLRFCTLDQWPAEIRKERENDVENGPRPCLTIDKINQYIVQVVNDMRQGKPGINVRPQDDAADIETAKILKGLIRNIEDQSKADIAYSTAGESAAKIGLGYFRITTEYVDDESFDQEIFIRPIPNTFSVYLGKHIMPDGSDAEHGFIAESIPVEKFKSEFPKAKCTEQDFEGLDAQISGYWRTEETITVVEYFCIKREAQELLFLADGTTMSQADYGKWPESVEPKPAIKDRRTSYKRQLKWHKMTAVEVLEKRDLPGKFIPIVEVVGRESWVDGRRILWGLVRPAKDSLRMYNYWASTVTERMALAPKQPYVAAEGQIEGREQEWKTANKTNRSVLQYKVVDVNGTPVPPPRREGPVQMEAALLQQMQVIEHDVQTSLGMFKAATGESESQQSGRAILALQKESDTGTYHFGANLGVSIRHAGRIIVDLIPHYYDTKRVIRILGEDGEVKTAQIDPDQEQAHRRIQTDGGIKSIYNPSVGKYDVSITVGPSYNTKRMEDQALYVEMAKGAADPASAAILRYLAMRNSDTPGAQEAAKLFKSVLPPQALQALATNEPIPPQVQAQMTQMQQRMQQMQEQGQELQQQNVQLKAGAQVQMQKNAGEMQVAQAEFTLQKQRQDAEIQLAREKAAAEIQAAREKAQAELELKRAIALADLEVERMKITEGANAEVDAAIAKVKSMIMVHETKINGELAKTEAAGEGAEEKPAQVDMAALQKMHDGFLQAMQQVVNGLAARKTISMKMPDGRTASASVMMQ